MKKSNYKFTIAAMVLSILFILPACGIQKRRYTKGFYIPGRAHMKSCGSKSIEKETITLKALNNVTEIETKKAVILEREEEAKELIVNTNSEFQQEETLKLQAPIGHNESTAKSEARSNFQEKSTVRSILKEGFESKRVQSFKRISKYIPFGIIILGVLLIIAIIGTQANSARNTPKEERTKVEEPKKKKEKAEMSSFDKSVIKALIIIFLLIALITILALLASASNFFQFGSISVVG